MQYQVSLGTEKLLAAELLRDNRLTLAAVELLSNNRLTLAARQPAAIPRWFVPGYASKEAAERAVIAEAQRLRTAPPDDIHHPDWITRTSPQQPLPASHFSATPQPSPLGSARSHSPSPADHFTDRTPPSPAAGARRLPCFLAITGPAQPQLSRASADAATASPQRSVHTMLTRCGAQARGCTPPLYNGHREVVSSILGGGVEGL